MKHKFADGDIKGMELQIDGDVLISTIPAEDYYFTKEDLIAMAKLIGIVGEDLEAKKPVCIHEYKKVTQEYCPRSGSITFNKCVLCGDVK